MRDGCSSLKDTSMFVYLYEHGCLPTFVLTRIWLMLDIAQPTFHLYHKGEKTSEVVGADAKKLEAAMESLHK